MSTDCNAAACAYWVRNLFEPIASNEIEEQFELLSTRTFPVWHNSIKPNQWSQGPNKLLMKQEMNYISVRLEGVKKMSGKF